jgi:nucleoside-diphosphate-sugar epimerase
MKIIIAGAGAVGTHLAKMLSDERHDIVLIDEGEERLANLESNFDLMTLGNINKSVRCCVRFKAKTERVIFSSYFIFAGFISI